MKFPLDVKLNLKTQTQKNWHYLFGLHITDQNLKRPDLENETSNRAHLTKFCKINNIFTPVIDPANSRLISQILAICRTIYKIH